ncbi:hypothetical protein [Clostridium butyricum]
MDFTISQNIINNSWANRTVSTHRIIGDIYSTLNRNSNYHNFNDNFYNIECMELNSVNITYFVKLNLYPLNNSIPQIAFFITGTIVGSTANRKYLKLSNIQIQFL